MSADEGDEVVGGPSDSEVAEPLSSSRLTRRAAMRASLGGAAAAVAWSAPRIEGFSVAPDFAAAATCTTAAPSSNIAQTRAAINCNNESGNEACCIMCWNATGVTAGACQNFNNGYYGTNVNNCNAGTRGCGDSTNQRLAGSINIAKNAPAATNITLNYNIWGPIDKTDFGNNATLAFSITGIDPPFQNCRVTVAGTCSEGTFSLGNCVAPAANITLPSNTTNYGDNVGPISSYPCTNPGGTNGNFVPGCTGANNNCTSTASLTITLSCTCA